MERFALVTGDGPRRSEGTHHLGVPVGLGEGGRHGLHDATVGDGHEQLVRLLDPQRCTGDRPPGRGLAGRELLEQLWGERELQLADLVIGQVLDRHVLAAGQRVVPGDGEHARFPPQHRAGHQVGLGERQAGDHQLDLPPPQGTEPVAERQPNDPDGAPRVGCLEGGDDRAQARADPARGPTTSALLACGAVAGPLFVATALVGGGVFTADPALGFPIGAAEGPPASISWHGTLHGVAFALGMTSLIAACLVLARWLAVAGNRGWARYSVATAVAFVLLGGAGFGLGDWRLVATAIVLGWGWLAIVAARLRAGLATG